jgi:hypothetical protein
LLVLLPIVRDQRADPAIVAVLMIGASAAFVALTACAPRDTPPHAADPQLGSTFATFPPGEDRRTARAAAQLRARELLRAHLNDEQRAEYDRRRSFVVETPRGRRYRIKSTSSYNVHGEVDGIDYCVQLRSDATARGVPLEDQMLAQKLLLELDEPRFLRIANRRA